MSERREQKSERTNGPILTSPFQEVLNLSAAVGKFVIHVHITPHLVGWSFCWLFGFVFTILAFPGCFLDAPSHLYKRVCPSVRPSVRRAVGPSVRRSVTPSLRRVRGASYAVYSALFVFEFH